MRPRDEECRGLDTKRKSKQDRRAARRAKKHATRNKQRKQSLQCYEHDDDNGDDMNTTMTVCVFESEAFCANSASFIQNCYRAHCTGSLCRSLVGIKSGMNGFSSCLPWKCREHRSDWAAGHSWRQGLAMRLYPSPTPCYCGAI